MHGRLTPEYRIWNDMKKRCYSPSSTAFHNYGARGITVCDRWRENFDHFLTDMGPKPSPKHSIDRINNDGHYEPGNCRWTTPDVQANNNRRNQRREHNGQTMTLAQWARTSGINRETLDSRLKRGWTMDRALHTPPSRFIHADSSGR